MARFSCITFSCFLLSATIAVGQSIDTTYLREVRVYGLPVNTYATGSKVELIKSDNAVTTLSDNLINETSLYLKTYGNNQLSTITLRGTTASQTAVLWNGININSPTLGQTDFSLIPLFLFDEVSIRYGTASSLYGSDAIGGTIMIGQHAARFDPGVSGTFFQEIGSFGKYNTGLKTTYGNNRWEFRTALYRASLENNFPYTSPAVGYAKEQNQARVLNYGFDQQAHVKISNTQQLSVEGMFTHNFREIQPAVTNNASSETLADNHVRLSLNYQNDLPLGILSATVGYVVSDQDYTNDVVSTVKSEQLTTLISIDKAINTRIALRYGLTYSHYTASSENFGGTIGEDRYDGFLSFRYALHRFWIMNLNIRQSFYAGRYAPFAPTLGTELEVLHAPENKLTFRAQGARGFRVPTLNDRYWVPGGNPNVTPEDAFHLEAGVAWNRKWQDYQLTIDGAGYRSWISDMIVWTPRNNLWSPTNLRRVDIYGTELVAKLSCKKGKFNLSGKVMYSYTRSINKEGVNDFDLTTINKQLTYVPIHTTRVSVVGGWNSWEVGALLNVTSQRYTTLDNETAQALDPYALVDASLDKKFKTKRLSFQLRAEALNVFDVYYENLKNHAMPGRHYALSLSIHLSNKPTL